MIGVPYNPSDCVFVANQALNANQFADPSAPDSANTTVHTILWDFVLNKLYWVNAKTNIIEHEIPGANDANLSAEIGYVGVTGPDLEFNVAVTGGTAPYTYQWALKSAPLNNYSINGASTTVNVLLTPDASPEPKSLAQVTVTDAQGRKTKAYHFVYNTNIIP